MAAPRSDDGDGRARTARPEERLGEATFEAIVCAWEGTAIADRTSDGTEIRRRVEALCAAGVHVFLVSQGDVADVDAQLGARSEGPGRLHLCVNRGAEVFEAGAGPPERRWQRTSEIGSTDTSDSARWAARWLAERGITGRLILVCGHEFGSRGEAPGRDTSLLIPELARAAVVSVGREPGGVPPGVVHLGGGPDRFLRVLDAQLARRADRRVPSVDEDPAWVVALPDDSGSTRTTETIGTLANGSAGIRGAREEDGPGTSPQFAVSGIYTTEAVPRLLGGPVWIRLDVAPGVADERLLDLRTGVLVRGATDGSRLRTLRFVSAARPEAMGLRAEGQPAELQRGPPFWAPDDGPEMEHRDQQEVRLARTADPAGGGITVAARDRETSRHGLRIIERLAAWTAGAAHAPPWDDAAARLAGLEAVGFDRLLAEHREAWARCWADAEVSIEGAPEDELAARLATFHVLAAAGPEGEAAVGARGLTGPAYGGHVFWDADVFVLPALAAVRPAAARSMLEYRIRRLAAARQAAQAQGLEGARFPWESAGDGRDVTPRRALGLAGEVIPILTGQHEEHIVACVAWAAAEYAAWTADPDFLSGPGRVLLLDTARYWASRVTFDAGGRGHLLGLIGPDEYHEMVDDNAFTNVMARWNLREAAALTERLGGDRDEAAHWRSVAAALVDGWDPARGLYEQFVGYWDLEALVAAEIAPPPFAADMLLGRERVRRSQLIKQSDVLMLHHLVPDEVAPGSLRANLAFYEPRTTHGSSLSPALHAALFARTHQPDRALELFRIAARLDLDDLTGTTAGGLHLATMAGVWHALGPGFLGLRPRGETLHLDPCLPRAWKALSLRFRFRGQPLRVVAGHDQLTVQCDRPLEVQIAERPTERCAPPGRSFAMEVYV